MCDALIVMFSNMATNQNDQAIVNPPAFFRSAVWKYYGFPAKDGTTVKSKTDPDIVQFLKDSSCLDPRFRSMSYLDETEKLDVYTALTLKPV